MIFQGGLYLSVINDVINESRLDFEDSGIDETTLQELRQVWQEKLSAQGIAVSMGSGYSSTGFWDQVPPVSGSPSIKAEGADERFNFN